MTSSRDQRPEPALPAVSTPGRFSRGLIEGNAYSGSWLSRVVGWLFRNDLPIEHYEPTERQRRLHEVDELVMSDKRFGREAFMKEVQRIEDGGSFADGFMEPETATEAVMIFDDWWSRHLEEINVDHHGRIQAAIDRVHEEIRLLDWIEALP